MDDIRVDEDEVEEVADALMAQGTCFDRASAVFMATRQLKDEAKAALAERAKKREDHHPRARSRRDRTVLV